MEKKEEKLIKDTKEVSELLDASIDDLNETLEEIRPYIAMDGGNMVVEAIKGLKIFIRLEGACDGCMHAGVTLQYGVEELLREKIHPDIEVIGLDQYTEI